MTGVIICKWAFLSLRNEGYIFIRDSTCIRACMLSGQTDRYMGGLCDGCGNGWIGRKKEWGVFCFLFIIIYITNFAPMFRGMGGLLRVGVLIRGEYWRQDETRGDPCEDVLLVWVG